MNSIQLIHRCISLSLRREMSINSREFREIFIEKNCYYDGKYREDREKSDAERTGLEEGQDLGASGDTKTRTNRIYRNSTVDSNERSNHESS